MITAKNISVEIDGKKLLKNINYDFEKGKVYGIIGPNGAGKSTFLRVLSGFMEPAQGKISFLNQNLIKPQKDISIVWQKPYLFHTNVFENIAYGLKVRHFKKDYITEKTNEFLKIFKINHLKNQKAKLLSGGEAAKVAIARAVATSPLLLILDEPTASLDPQNVREIEKIIIELKEEFKITIIIVTHNLFQAKRIADETLFFYNGELIEAGLTSNIFNNPSNNLTKKFINDESLFY